MQFIDTHTHIYSQEFDSDRLEVCARAEAVGVDVFCVPNVDCETLPAMLSVCKNRPSCHPMLGLHPTSVNESYRNDLERLKPWLQTIPFIAIGEIGIDLYWDKTFLVEQQDALAEQIRWAEESRLPIVVHLRNAFEELKEVFESHAGTLPGGIIHCFSGTISQAEYFLDKGFALGIGGVVTFKNNGDLEAVVKAVPLSSLVLETDAPYLAPVPHRGKRNESAYIPLIAEKTAALKNCSVNEVATVTTETAKRIFNL